jgi:hypothetical protein
MPHNEMNCAFCNTETSRGVRGPAVLFICFGCVGNLSVEKEIDTEGKCSWCGTALGKVKGFFRRRKIKAVALNENTGVILCNECGLLCCDIMKNETQAHHGLRADAV